MFAVTDSVGEGSVRMAPVAAPDPRCPRLPRELVCAVRQAVCQALDPSADTSTAGIWLCCERALRPWADRYPDAVAALRAAWERADAAEANAAGAAEVLLTTLARLA